MLVLSRRPDTAIQIGDDVKVTVLSIRRRQVKLGIDAPNGVSIWRQEITPTRWGENVDGHRTVTHTCRNPGQSSRAT